MKGARILEFEKLREICGDYQQLNYAKGAQQCLQGLPGTNSYDPAQERSSFPSTAHKHSILTTKV